MTMEMTMLILTVIGTMATLISTIIAVRAKNEVKGLLNEVKNRNLYNSGKIDIQNSGKNSGVISAINTGEVNGNVKSP